jgi:endonuclease/exonuclease/phosphatase family metal-dependent hydrolase
MGNKGGTVVAFTFHDSSLCFVNTHLAAHQDKVERRNADVAEVIRGIKLGHKGKYDILNQYHHVFWMGDLNYRLDFGDQGEAKKPSEEQFNKMVKMVDDKKFGELFEHDQLAKSMGEKKVFVGFQEGKCNFPPTFKVLRNENLVYSEKRSPAWCDRILWKSMPGLEGDIKQSEFNAAIKIMSSDHKPVYGVFALRRFHLPWGVDYSKGPATITITGLKGKNLAALDVGGTSDPFVQFRSPVITHNLVETPVIKKNLNPTWPDKQVPKIELSVNDEKRLAKSFIFIRVLDKDRGSKDDLIGGAVLPLAGVCSGKPIPFNLQLTQFGLPSGTIEGTLHLEWGKPHA